MAELIITDKTDPDRRAADVGRLLDVVEGGGFGIVGLDVAYAIVGAREGAIRRMFEAKERSYEKPCGFFGHWTMSRRIHELPAWKHAIVREMSEQGGLPFSVVAPYKRDHAIFAKSDAFVLDNSSKNGTMDMLLNAGPVHDEIALQSLDRGIAVFGSSANRSNHGAKYALDEIEQQVRDAADIELDCGRSRWANPMSRASSIIDFVDFTVIRIGIEFEQVERQFRERFGITLTITPNTAGRAA